MRGALILVLGALLLVAGASAAPDGTPPVVTFQAAGTQRDNGWYASPVTVSWQFGDPESGITASSGCDTKTLAADTAGTQLTCAATNGAQMTTSVSLTVRLDRTAPVVTGSAPDRPPDNAGWYTRPVVFAFAGVDAMSGVAACTAATYAGPDSSSASVPGTCTDHAGNVSAPAGASLKFDQSSPALRAVTARAREGVVTVRWTPLPESEWVEIVRSPGRGSAPRSVVFRGQGGRFVDKSVRNGVPYRYEVTGRDPAGHSTGVPVAARPIGPLRTPAEGARLTKPPLLTWKATKGASFYNVQVFRAGRKLLSAWPARPRLRLARTWSFGGERRRLSAGRYTWWVWPAFRRGGKLRYGKPIGRSTFTVGDARN